MLSKDKFIEKFNSPRIKFDTFLNRAKVKSSNRLIPLETYIQEHKIPLKDIFTLWENIHNRDEYLSRFYDTSLKPTIPLTILEYPMLLSNLNNNTKVQYKNIIRNMYYTEILKTTQSGLENLLSFMTVLENLYLKNIIDYKILTPSSRFFTKKGRIGSVFSSFYFRASIMNPYLVYSLQQRILKGERIFTPTLGWSSYCYGFMESPKVVEYVGIDVIPKVCNTTVKFAHKFYPNKSVETYCQPSEDFLQNTAFLRKYSNHFDVVFFSPPYYRLELYDGQNQSTTRYKTYQEWLDGYWTKTVDLCYRVLQKGGRMCYIISNYGAEDDKIDLVKDCNRITKSIGFKPYRTLKMHNKAVTVNVGQNDNSETICIFTK